MTRWLAEELENGDAKVSPIDDAVDHTDEDCACGPRIEPVKRHDGSIGWVTVHHSLDGRELDE